MTKWIFITGGVASSLGKGVSGASIGKLLQMHGYSVTMAKCDPYFNVDPGTMNPYQHGEVYVAADGCEADLDLGYYERYLGVKMTKANTNTSGDIYKTVIEREMAGGYNGKTVQVIPHITDEIKKRINIFDKKVDIAIIEIGGTVGDIEGLPFLEAIRQFAIEKGKNNVIHIHLTLLPFIGAAMELKTKPTQHSVAKLREAGIMPNIIICRTDRHVEDSIKQKIAMFCNVPKHCVLDARDLDSIYHIPEDFYKQGIDKLILSMLLLDPKKKLNTKFFDIVNGKLSHTVHIAIAGKYVGLKDAYKSISESLYLAGINLGIKVCEHYLDSEDNIILKLDELKSKGELSGILVPGGYGSRGIAGKIEAIKYARENKVPFLGICLGMQCTCIEYARNMAGIPDASSMEIDALTKNPVIAILNEQRQVTSVGGTQRLGEYEAKLNKKSLAYKLYGKKEIVERHRHRFELNPEYVASLEEAGLQVSAYHKERLPEIVELPENIHPFFIAVQFHPEFSTSVETPNPLFKGLIEASKKYNENR